MRKLKKKYLWGMYEREVIMGVAIGETHTFKIEVDTTQASAQIRALGEEIQELISMAEDLERTAKTVRPTGGIDAGI